MENKKWLQELGLESDIERCLSSNEIKRLVDAGIISGTDKATLDQRIQPATLEPTLGEEVFILDIEHINHFRPSEREDVYKSLLQIPSKRRIRQDISDGFEMKVGYTYLFPLEERFSNLPEDLVIRASPKSSIGRLFNDNRLLFDYSSSLNELRLEHPFEDIRMWLMVQPKAFNTIVGPRLVLNQIRFLTGAGAQLTADELRQEQEKYGIVSLLGDGEEGKLIPVDRPIISHEGVRLKLDLEGKVTYGVVGLQAKKNPLPIDIRSNGKYPVHDYFEPRKIDGTPGGRTGISIYPEEPFLLTSHEFVSVPPHLCAELKSFSDVSISGIWHRAGFFDPGFRGTATLEVTSDEPGRSYLEHEMPISDLTFFRVGEGDKVYGQEIGSNYQDQTGPRPAKWFSLPPLGFGELARTYNKLNVKVLVAPTDDLLRIRQNQDEDGFEPATKETLPRLDEVLKERSFFVSRYHCEDDELILQLIPYVIVTNKAKDEIYVYERGNDPVEYGDKRLFGKLSIGFGGHINKEKDGPDYLRNCLEREVDKEELIFANEHSEPVLVGTLMSHKKPVDRVHFGLIYVVDTDGEVLPNEKSINWLKPYKTSDLQDQFRQEENPDRYETWTAELIKHLPVIRAISQNAGAYSRGKK